MIQKIPWSEFKTTIINRGLQHQMTENALAYKLSAFDNQLTYLCDVLKEPSVELTDYETNFKSKANQKLTSRAEITSIPPSASKNFGTSKLFKRVVGVQHICTQGMNIINWTCLFPWAKITSLEIINGEAGDTVSLKVLDTATGAYSTIPNATLNQFGFSANVAKDLYVHRSEFDADLYAGLQIQLEYHSVSTKTIGINFVMNEVKA